MGRGDRRLEVSSVDDPATYRHVVEVSRAQVLDLLTVAPAAQVLVAGEHAAPARPCQPLGCLGEVLGYLAASGPLVVTGILADLVDTVLAERQRVHAVERRGGVQANERIRIDPVTPRMRPAVDHGHLDVRLGHQCVGEGKAARARSHH